MGRFFANARAETWHVGQCDMTMSDISRLESFVGYQGTTWYPVKKYKELHSYGNLDCGVMKTHWKKFGGYDIEMEVEQASGTETFCLKKERRGATLKAKCTDIPAFGHPFWVAEMDQWGDAALIINGNPNQVVNGKCQWLNPHVDGAMIVVSSYPINNRTSDAIAELE